MKDLINKINELKVGESLQISPTFKVTCKAFKNESNMPCNLCAFEEATNKFCNKLNCFNKNKDISVYYSGFNCNSIINKLNQLKVGESCDFSEDIKVQVETTAKYDAHSCSKCFFENTEVCVHLNCLDNDVIFVAKLKK